MNGSDSLLTLIEEHMKSGDVDLPVFDNTATKIYRQVRDNSINADEISELLEQDPILASEVLRMANSSFFAGLSEIRSVKEASVRLGNKRIASIVMSIGQKRLYSASKGPFRNRLLRLWNHSSVVSQGARWLALSTGHVQLADEVFVAGLLHDVGKLSLLRIIEELAQNGKLPLTNEVVNDTLLKMYTSHGAKLLEMWNLPELFQSVLLQLETDDFDENNMALVIVRLVDKACAVEGISDFPDPTLALETLRETDILGLCEIDLAELRIALEDANGVRMAA